MHMKYNYHTKKKVVCDSIIMYNMSLTRSVRITLNNMQGKCNFVNELIA